MQLRAFLIFPVLLVLLAGCATSTMSPQDRAQLEQPARSLEAREEWLAAAAAWKKASLTVDGDIALELQLNAADALLKAGDGLGAAQTARALPQDIPAGLGIRRTLILADASIQAGDPADALKRAGPGLTTNDQRLLARYRRIRADALEMSNDALGAARERVVRDPLLDSTEDRYRNRQRIWDLLAQVSTEQLEAPIAQPGSAFSGWLELAAIARRNALDVGQLDSAIQQWSIRFPGHPAGEQIVPEIIELARTAAQPPSKVALLLPQTGPFATVAAAIRDGFMAAWYADAPNRQRPEIIMLDTHAQDAALAYSNAINNGAQFVVGPLDKKSVSAVINDTALNVTTLALNYPLTEAASTETPGTNTAATSTATTGTEAGQQATQTDAQMGESQQRQNLQRAYYFVLSPEDEARQTAEYAYQRGARQAAILSAAGTWGERVGEAFAQRWTELGGLVVNRTRYPEEAQGLSAAVEQLLNIDRSEARAKRLRAVLVRDIKHEPQPRSDIDVIFMAAFPQAARQLRPLLLFHRAALVPVLATSHAYAGTADPQADQDLNGIIFAEMPWLVTPNAHSLPAQVRALWPDSDGALGRLYAFGADAYRLISQLRELRVSKNSSFAGLTGTLSLNGQQGIRRDMQWSSFVTGLAQPADAAMQSSGWGPSP